MRLSIPSRLFLGPIIGLLFAAPACEGRNVVGMQSGQGGSDGGLGGNGGKGGKGGKGGTTAGNPDGGPAGAGGSSICPPGFRPELVDTSITCVPEGAAGTLGVAGSSGPAGTSGGGGFAGDWGVAGTFGVAGTTGGGGTGGTGGSSSTACGAPGGSSGGFRFSSPIQHLVPRGPTAVVVGELNADGRPDLAVVNREDHDVGGAGGGPGAGAAGTNGAAGSDFLGKGSVSVLLSNGASGYLPPQHYLPSGGPTSIAVGDLNGDQKQDLVVTRGESLSILFNAGSGTFLAPVTFATGRNPSVAVGDVTGDGRADFVVGNRSYPDSPERELVGDVGVFRNMGSGTFIAANFPAGPSPTALALAPLSGTGMLDVAVASGPGVSVLLNTAGDLGPPASYGAGTSPQVIAARDLNGDGSPDLALSSYRGTHVMLNLGDGSFAAAITYDRSHLASIAIGDLNRDGRLDLAGAVSSPCAPVTILPNTGNGTFGEPVSIPTTSDGGWYGGVIALHDMNGDGALDLVVPNAGGVAVLLNTAP